MSTFLTTNWLILWFTRGFWPLGCSRWPQQTCRCLLHKSLQAASPGRDFHVSCFVFVLDNIGLYRVSQEECARLREGVPYVKVYRYNPKHLCPNLNVYEDNGPEKFETLTAVTHLLITKYILKLAGICGFCNVNISVHKIKLTCEWHKAIKLNYKNTRTHVRVVVRLPSTIHENAQLWRNMADCAFRYKPTT